MYKLLTLLFLLVVILGCSNSDGISVSDIKAKADVIETGNNHWSWGIWELRFNDDHTKLDVAPFRGAQYHYCVTKLMEEYPCNNCLGFSQPKIQPDGTVKLNITLRHPFPNAPKYTGFDVRGMVYFQYTEYHIAWSGPYVSLIYYFPPPSPGGDRALFFIK